MTSQLAAVRETLQALGLTEHFDVDTHGLQVKGEPSIEDCEDFYNACLTLHQTIQMVIGDAARYFRERFGKLADQIISARTGWSHETQRNYEWVAEHVPKDVRRLDVLSFSHHQKVAKLPAREQKKWLDRAAEGDDGEPWPVRRLANAVKAGEDQPVTSWVLIVYCDRERVRKALQSELEGRGMTCKTSEKRGTQ